MGYRADDHDDSAGSSLNYVADLYGNTIALGSGLIEREIDTDRFEVLVGVNGPLVITASNAPTDPNLKISLKLLDKSGARLASAELAGTLDAKLSASVTAGTYYIDVTGSARGVPRAVSDKEFLILPKLVGTTTTIPPFVRSAARSADPWARRANEDPDGDGQSNLEEHAAGTDPTMAELPVMVDVRDGDGPEEVNVDVCLRLPATAPSDVQYELQHRADLEGPWSTVATKVGNGPWLGLQPGSPLPGGPGRVRHVFDERETTGSFYRLKLTLLSP